MVNAGLRLKYKDIWKTGTASESRAEFVRWMEGKEISMQRDSTMSGTRTQVRGTSFRERRRPNAPQAEQPHESISPQVANLLLPARALPYSPRKAALPRERMSSGADKGIPDLIPVS